MLPMTPASSNSRSSTVSDSHLAAAAGPLLATTAHGHRAHASHPSVSRLQIRTKFAQFICLTAYQLLHAPHTPHPHAADGVDTAAPAFRATVQYMHHLLTATSHMLPLPIVMIALRLVARIGAQRHALRPAPNSELYLLVVALMLAQKTCDDVPFSNQLWRRLLNLPMHHILAMEREVLVALDYRIHVRPDEYAAWAQTVRGWAQTWERHDRAKSEAGAAAAATAAAAAAAAAAVAVVAASVLVPSLASQPALALPAVNTPLRRAFPTSVTTPPPSGDLSAAQAPASVLAAPMVLPLPAVLHVPAPADPAAAADSLHAPSPRLAPLTPQTPTPTPTTRHPHYGAPAHAPPPWPQAHPLATDLFSAADASFAPTPRGPSSWSVPALAKTRPPCLAWAATAVPFTMTSASAAACLPPRAPSAPLPRSCRQGMLDRVAVACREASDASRPHGGGRTAETVLVSTARVHPYRRPVAGQRRRRESVPQVASHGPSMAH